MITLICTVQHLALADRSRVHYMEQFEVDEKTAEHYLRAGVAVRPSVKPVPVPSVSVPEPTTEKPRYPVSAEEERDAGSTPEPATNNRKGRKR